MLTAAKDPNELMADALDLLEALRKAGEIIQAAIADADGTGASEAAAVEATAPTLFPTSPDGTDWGIYGDTPWEQWQGVRFEAVQEDEHRARLYGVARAPGTKGSTRALRRHNDPTLSKEEMVKRLDDDGVYILNGDGWEPDEELTRQEAEQAVIDFCRGKLEQEKITIGHDDGAEYEIRLTVDLVAPTEWGS